MWKSPTYQDLRSVIAGAHQRLLLCSPYVSRRGLAIVEDNIPESVTQLEFWTRLSTQDWLTSVSEPDGILEFVEGMVETKRSVALRESNNLHAKMVLSDGTPGLAGSANLTRGGFVTNIEVVRVVDGDELDQLREYAEGLRPRLQAISLEQLRSFVSQCLSKTTTQEALLDLIRTEIPEPILGPSPLIPYARFLEVLRSSPEPLAQEILSIALNHDGNNNSGKVKHAFYGVQRFLQEHPEHLDFVAALPDAWFDVSDSPLSAAWQTFLSQYEAEESEEFRYSVRTLIRYLTPSSGGTRTGGGGGDNELKRVWPFVGRLMRQGA